MPFTMNAQCANVKNLDHWKAGGEVRGERCVLQRFYVPLWYGSGHYNLIKYAHIIEKIMVTCKLL